MLRVTTWVGTGNAAAAAAFGCICKPAICLTRLMAKLFHKVMGMWGAKDHEY